MLGAYGFQGVQAVGDGSTHQGRMGAGVGVDMLYIDQMWSIRVGREGEVTNSKRPELAALASVLRAVHVPQFQRLDYVICVCICAQACSASLKRTQNLSANKRYNYY
jgi:hypothetical protein